MRFPLASPVLDAASRLLAPVVLLFAVYVVAHGHDSPGGGFQGGVLFAAGMILVKLTRGGLGGWEIGPAAALSLACTGVAIFAGIGFAAVAYGGNYLDYAVPPLLRDPVTERVVGTLGIEIGVALTVTGVILLVFDALVGWDDREEPS
jgi:multicomponent Na+:H+ antiporter subunit B